MGSIGANYGKYQQYKFAAREAESKGDASRTAYYKQATNLEKEARADSHLAGRNMMRARENQNSALSAVRTKRASSGFTAEGSGQQEEIAAADVMERAISDMSLSNAISDQNKRYAADVSRFQGDLGMTAARNTANQYRSLGSNALGSAWLQLGMTAAGAGYGATGGSIGAIQAYQMGDSLTSMVPGSVSKGSDKSSAYFLSLLDNWMQGKA